MDILNQTKWGGISSVANTGLSFLKGLGKTLENVVDAFAVFGTAVADNGRFVGDTYVPYTPGKRGLNDEAWKGVMGFVADDHVESAYKNFYENAEAGKWLDKNAYQPFKSTGVASEISSGLGEVAGIVTLTALTGAPAPAVAGVAGAGKYTGQYWNDARKNAKPGEDWTTEKNRNNGILYGAANGAWEATQWAVGGALKDLTIKGAKPIVTSAVRVGIDTVFNAADTPFRTLVDAATSDKTLKEAWEGQGGWQSVFVNTGIGLIGSIGGEAFDNYKTKKELSTTKYKTIPQSNSDKFFQGNQSNGGNYGVDQGLFTRLKEENPQAYNDVKKVLMEKYNFASESDIDKIMLAIDTAGGGACPYAANLNNIVEYYSDKESLFKETFGFDLYRKTADGKTVINDTELFMDYWLWGNDINTITSDGSHGYGIYTDSNGKKHFDMESMYVDKENKTGFKQRGGAYSDLNDYLTSRDGNASCTVKEVKNYKKALKIIQENKGGLSMGMSGGIFNDMETGEIINFSGSHWVKITDIADDKILVSSWGRKYSIELEDVINQMKTNDARIFFTEFKN